MIDSPSVLFGLEGEFVVTSLERLSSSDLRVGIEQREREAPFRWTRMRRTTAPSSQPPACPGRTSDKYCSG